MKRCSKWIGLGIVVAMWLALAGCKAAAPVEPTIDLNVIKTEAVLTAIAQMTAEAALNPTATSIPPTNTPLPTATLVTLTPQGATGGTGTGTGGGGSGVDKTPIPSSTPDAWKCDIVDEYPLDKPQMTGWEYDRHWVIKNIGTTTWWADDVYIKFDDTCSYCENITYFTKAYIKQNVAPGQTYDFFVDVDVPTQPKAYPGYSMEWQMISENGGLICEFWNNIPSTYPAPTKTPIP